LTFPTLLHQPKLREGVLYKTDNGADNRRGDLSLLEE
jgi:hypothetical protein